MLRLPTGRLVAEFEQLRRENFPLALVVDGLARFVRDAYSRDVVVTSIFRSPRLQESVYGNGTKKVGSSFEVAALAGLDRAGLRTASPHMAWLAVDVASARHAPSEVDAMLAFLRRYDPHNRLPVIQPAASRTVWLHEAGTLEPHFHIQYKGPPVHAV